MKRLKADCNVFPALLMIDYHESNLVAIPAASVEGLLTVALVEKVSELKMRRGGALTSVCDNQTTLGASQFAI